MKILKNITAIMVFSSLMPLATHTMLNTINLPETVQQAKILASQVDISNDLTATAESIKHVVARNLALLPDKLVGEQIENLRKGLASKENLRNVQQAIAEVTQKLPLVIAALEFPDFVIDGLNAVLNPNGKIYPKLVAFAGNDASRLALLNALRTAVNFGIDNKDAVAVIFHRLAIVLSTLNASLINLQNTNLASLDTFTLAQKFGEFIHKFEAEYKVALPLISSFITKHQDALKNIFAQFKDLNLNIDAQALLQAVQNQLAQQGF